MDLLIDTHVLIWLTEGDDRGERIVGPFMDQDAVTISVSIASYLEVAIKHSIGKLAASVEEVRSCVRGAGMLKLPITANHAEIFATLPPHHCDPFDRLLIVQALADDLTIATVDPTFLAYDGLRLIGVS